MIVIAHRRGVLDAADRLLVLEEGRPKMIGPASEVVARLAGPQDRGECRMSEAVVLHADAQRSRQPARARSARARSIAVLFFVVFLGWAAFVPLDAGVNAPGTIAVLGNRQTVQHKDGGVITAIHVREGQHVQAGQVLVELSAPELQASERALTSDYLTLARAARAAARRTHRPARFRAAAGIRLAQPRGPRRSRSR